MNGLEMETQLQSEQAFCIRRMKVKEHNEPFCRKKRSWWNNMFRRNRSERKRALELTALLVIFFPSVVSVSWDFAPGKTISTNDVAVEAMFDKGDTTRAYGKANKEKIECYIMLIRLRHDLYLKWKTTGKWPDDKEANAALGQHAAYWEEQLKAGRVILTGGMKGDYWDNVALIIFEASSEKEANEIVANDPAVKAFVFQAQVRPFDISGITDKFMRR